MQAGLTARQRDNTMARSSKTVGITRYIALGDILRVVVNYHADAAAAEAIRWARDLSAPGQSPTLHRHWAAASAQADDSADLVFEKCRGADPTQSREGILGDIALVAELEARIDSLDRIRDIAPQAVRRIIGAEQMRIDSALPEARARLARARRRRVLDPDRIVDGAEAAGWRISSPKYMGRDDSQDF